MKKFRTMVAVFIMVVAAFVGIFCGDFMFDSEACGAILFAMIAGIACIIYNIDNQGNNC